MNNIEILEDAIKCNKKQFEETGTHILLQDDEMKAIENLIQEYKELKKQMGKDLDVVYIKGVYDERDKWKSKVKEKIEETNNEKLNYSEDEYYLESEIKGYAIDKLQELLEEGE